MNLRKAGFFAAAALAAIPALAGHHFGEIKDLDVDIEYFDYAFKAPNGEPVYYIGSPIRYQVKINNTGNRTFNNFQARSTLKWASSVSCTRWWFDNQTVSYQGGTPLPGPGDPSSGWRPADMKKGASASYQATYPIPMAICPGQAVLNLEGQHMNNGRSEAASFNIPLNVQFKRKE